MTTETDPLDVYLDAAQRARVIALREARQVLAAKSGFAGASLGDFGIVDLIDTAQWLLDGTHPYDRDTSGEVQHEAPVLAPAPVADVTTQGDTDD